MDKLRYLNYIPLRTISFLFVLYNNSDYAVFGKNIGFYCDDENIKKSYHGDSIHAKLLLSVLLVVAGVIIYLSELIYKQNNQQEHATDYKLFLKYYYTGLVHSLASVEVLKVFFTELRPHFFYTCLPDMNGIDCSKGLITDFKCTGEGAHWLVNRDIYKSFPSGHAALSMYAFIYISIYLYSKTTRGPQSILQVSWTGVMFILCFLWAVICSISRISDNRHFWWDVVAGNLIGLASGLLMIYLALNKVDRKTKSAEE